MEVLDAQIHLWGSGVDPREGWNPRYGLPGGDIPPFGTAYFSGDAPATDDLTVKIMDAVGVDGALLVTVGLHRFDNSYALTAASRHPERFRVVGKLDPKAPDIEEQILAWKTQQLAVGLRVVGFNADNRSNLLYEPFLTAVERHGVTLCVYCSGYLTDVALMAERHPQLQIVIDHLGLAPNADPNESPFRDLRDLLVLARYPNVAVKMTATPILSRQPPPFADLWPYLHQIIETFGPERTIWGSDCTRIAHQVGYDEVVRQFTETTELSHNEKQLLLAANLRRIFKWS